LASAGASPGAPRARREAPLPMSAGQRWGSATTTRTRRRATVAASRSGA